MKVQNTIERPVARIAMLPQGFSLSPEVKDWEKNLTSHRGHRSSMRHTNVALCIALASVIAAFCVVSVVAAMNNQSEGALAYAAYGVVPFIIVGVLILASIKQAGTTRSRETCKGCKIAKYHLKRSVRTARKLGGAVPILTKDHIDTSIRFERRIGNYALAWKQPDFDAARALLFKDMDREEVIYSLIEERGMRTAAEVFETLASIESQPKSFQTGWL